MSLPRYPKYKNSGVEWLGEVPEHWGVGKCGFYIEILSGFAFPSAGFTDDEASTRLLRGINVGVSRLNWEETVYWTRRKGDGLDVYEMKEGDLVIGMDRPLINEGMRVAKVGLHDIPCLLLQRVASVKVRKRLDSDFLLRLLSSELFVAHFSPETTGVSVPHISPQQISTFAIPMPPVAEQVAIAAFLDRETAKIDALVGEQQRLIELLKEKRQAVISHAVTKGLNPNAPMKDSGIEWLGEIPKHWSVSPLKWLTDPKRPIMYGIVLPGPDVGDGVPILKGGNVKPSRMNLESMARTTAEIEAPYARARLRGGDLVYSIRGSIGDCEPVPPEMEGANITQDVARVAVARENSATWVRWALLAPAVREDLASGSLGAAVRGVNIFDLKRAQIPTPPADEQVAIARSLDHEAAKLETLTTEAQRAIDLLQERRTALISAVVTGQIDVRAAAERAIA